MIQASACTKEHVIMVSTEWLHGKTPVLKKEDVIKHLLAPWTTIYIIAEKVDSVTLLNAQDIMQQCCE